MNSLNRETQLRVREYLNMREITPSYKNIKKAVSYADNMLVSRHGVINKECYGGYNNNNR